MIIKIQDNTKEVTIKKHIVLLIILLSALGLSGCGASYHHTKHKNHVKTHRCNNSNHHSSDSSSNSSSRSIASTGSHYRNNATYGTAPQTQANQTQGQGTQQYTAQGHYPTWKVGNVYYAKLPDGTVMQQTFADGDDPGSYQGNPEVQRETDQLQDQWAKEHGLN